MMNNEPSENLRRKKARDMAKEIYHEVNNREGDYFQNMEIESEHT
jgi:hypothetical protein